MKKAMRWTWGLAKDTFENVPWWVWTIGIVTIATASLIWGYVVGLTLLFLSGVAFGQNMAFTAVSRSRNAGDILYHRKCAWLSNGVWLLCSMFIWSHLFEAFDNKSYALLVPLFIIYIASTTEGSVSMMARLIKSESGKRRVGANEKIEQLEAAVKEIQGWMADFH
jgi:hypothetical protein